MQIIPKPIKIDKPWGHELFLISNFKNQSNFDKFPLSVYAKIIKAKTKLSIQVHPNHKLAKNLENEPYGKTEAWYIIDAKDGAGLYLGIKENINKDEFIKTLKDKKDPRPYLNFLEVKKGDFFYIPSGLIHSIGSGITLLEPQQLSNTTYRIYDYNRLVNNKLRDLHTNKALKAINFDKNFNNIQNIKKEKKLIKSNKQYGKYAILKSPHFVVEKYILKTNHSELNIKNKSYSLIWTKNTSTINNQELKNTEIMFVQKEKLKIKSKTNNTLIHISV